MNTSDLFKAVKHLNDKLLSVNMSKHLNTVSQNLTRLTQQTQSPSNTKQQYLTAIDNAKKAVIASLASIIPSPISEKESMVYEALNAYNLFGYQGAKRFTDIFSDINTNPGNALQKINEYQKDVAKIIQLYSSLSLFPSSITLSEEESTDKDLIILVFQGGVEINNLDEMSAVSKKWNQVLISFAILTGENDRSFRIESVERGSIILTLSAITGVVFAFATAADKVLDIVKKYYEIKKLVNSAKKIPGLPKSAVQELEKSSIIDAEKESEQVTKYLLEKYSWDEKPEKNEVSNGTKMAIMHLLKFIQNGGKVDVKLIKESNPEKQNIQLNLSLKYTEIKQIENSTPVIEEQKNITEADFSKGESAETDSP